MAIFSSVPTYRSSLFWLRSIVWMPIHRQEAIWSIQPAPCWSVLSFFLLLLLSKRSIVFADWRERMGYRVCIEEAKCKTGSDWYWFRSWGIHQVDGAFFSRPLIKIHSLPAIVSYDFIPQWNIAAASIHMSTTLMASLWLSWKNFPIPFQLVTNRLMVSTWTLDTLSQTSCFFLGDNWCCWC